jgi:benzoyl-CoA reductase/2-hydroxyglutaryl-CoA dehydratase subunit BcrC/BadD/HgdB
MWYNNFLKTKILSEGVYMEKIGITTTIPVEVVFAAGHVPVDLNNIFITNPNPSGLVQQAEEDGLPRTLCSWVKGIYSVIRENPDIRKIIAVSEGDCSNNLGMLDLLAGDGYEIITFAYPYDRDRKKLDDSISGLEKYFGVTRDMTESWRLKLDGIRKKALILDEMTWKARKVTGFENHLALISCSDFEGNPDGFEKKLDVFIKEASLREPSANRIKFGICGVPSVFSDLYDVLQELGVDVVFNEMQRQFAMPATSTDIADQYLNYTYPYSRSVRINDINREAETRKIDGMIHYVQSFCHHQIQAKRLREEVKCPTLTLEGDKPGPVMERSRIRLESFVEMLKLTEIKSL